MQSKNQFTLNNYIMLYYNNTYFNIATLQYTENTTTPLTTITADWHLRLHNRGRNGISQQALLELGHSEMLVVAIVMGTAQFKAKIKHIDLYF